jgi:hypothetical protein
MKSLTSFTTSLGESSMEEEEVLDMIAKFFGSMNIVVGRFAG